MPERTPLGQWLLLMHGSPSLSPPMHVFTHMPGQPVHEPPQATVEGRGHGPVNRRT